MNDMKPIRLLVLVTTLFLGITGIVSARVVRNWSYQELLDKSDLVVLASPASTNDTKEHIELPGFVGQRVLGLETRFTVSAVLKGDKKLKEFVLHHYRPGADGMIVPNGPDFVSFVPVANPTAGQQTYILFLIRETDGRYAPVVGQADPGLAIREVG
jgi:hypothetical protein